jgi:YD repeat-containing protein
MIFKDYPQWRHPGSGFYPWDLLNPFLLVAKLPEYPDPTKAPAVRWENRRVVLTERRRNGEATTSVRFGYDAEGRLTTIEHSLCRVLQSRVRIDYARESAVWTSLAGNPPSAPVTSTIVFDEAGRVVSMFEVPPGRRLSFDYAAGAMVTATEHIRGELRTRDTLSWSPDGLARVALEEPDRAVRSEVKLTYSEGALTKAAKIRNSQLVGELDLQRQGANVRAVRKWYDHENRLIGDYQEDYLLLSDGTMNLLRSAQTVNGLSRVITCSYGEQGRLLRRVFATGDSEVTAEEAWAYDDQRGTIGVTMRSSGTQGQQEIQEEITHFEPT